MALEVKDLEQIKALIVDPITTAVREEVAALILKDGQQEERLVNLERNQKRALVGMSVYATALAGFLGLCGEWVRKKLNIGQ